MENGVSSEGRIKLREVASLYRFLLKIGTFPWVKPYRNDLCSNLGKINSNATPLGEIDNILLPAIRIGHAAGDKIIIGYHCPELGFGAEEIDQDTNFSKSYFGISGVALVIKFGMGGGTR